MYMGRSTAGHWDWDAAYGHVLCSVTIEVDCDSLRVKVVPVHMYDVMLFGFAASFKSWVLWSG